MRKQEMVKQETKNRIVHAFWELYKTTNIEKITVKSITDACGIYRTTFYLHFADVYAILEQIEEDLLGEIRSFTLKPVRVSENKDDFMREVCKSFEKNYEYLHVLLDGRHDQNFAALYKKELTELMCTLHQMDLGTLKPEAREIAIKSFSAMIDLFLSLGDSEKVSFDKLLVIIDGYMKNGIISTLRHIYGSC